MKISKQTYCAKRNSVFYSIVYDFSGDDKNFASTRFEKQWKRDKTQLFRALTTLLDSIEQLCFSASRI